MTYLHKKEWYEIDKVREIDSPALIMYPDRVLHNIRLAKSFVNDLSLFRPHAKTHKSPDVTKLCIAEGIRKFKCATIAEAEMLAGAGATDVLFAYQPNGPKILRLLKLVKNFPQTIFSCLVDNLHSAHEIGNIFSAASLTMRVYIDLNIGMNRTGIAPNDDAVQLYANCATINGIYPIGLHAYDGHISVSDFTVRKQQYEHAFKDVEIVKNKLIQLGYEKPIVVAGGSPTFPLHAKHGNVECSPGTFVYWDKSYLDLFPEQQFLPATLVISRIISIVAPNRYCLDVGHKSIASENLISRRIFFLNAPDATFISHSEEHLIIQSEARYFAIGDVLYGMPYHICPTCALYEKGITVKDHIAQGEWSVIARNRKISI